MKRQPLKQYQQTNKQFDKNSKRIEEMREQAVKLKQNKQYGQALAVVTKMVNATPNDVRGYQLKGQLQYILQQYQAALQTYDQLLALTTIQQNQTLLTPTTHPLPQLRLARSLYYYNRALCLSKLSDHLSAITSLKKSLQLNPNRKEAAWCLAQSYRRVGKKEKGEMIVRKLVEQGRWEDRIRAVRVCLVGQQWQQMMGYVSEGIQKQMSELSATRQGTDKDRQPRIVQLYYLKGQCQRNQLKYNQSIQSFKQVLSLNPPSTFLIKTYTKLCLSLTHTQNLTQAIIYYHKLLQFQPKNYIVRNNLSNLLIRTQKYHQAVKILNQGILKMLGKQQCGQYVDREEQGGVVLMRCHRVVAMANIGLIQEANNDIRQVVDVLQGGKIEWMLKQQMNNYMFVKNIINKYSNSITKLHTLKQHHKHKPIAQLAPLQTQLATSMSQQLSHLVQTNNKQPINTRITTPQVDLDKLQNRIDTLYKQIVLFKKTTQDQHQENTDKVHNRIQEIQKVMKKRQIDREMVEKELDLLKKQHSQVYQIVQKITKEQREGQNRRLPSVLQRLRRQGRRQVATYLQQLYWVLNGYLLAVRMIANHLLPQPNIPLHLTTLSSWLSKFTSIFTKLTHLPHIGPLFTLLSTLTQLFIKQEHQHIYKFVNQVIRQKYTTQKELMEGLQEGIVAMVGKMENVERIGEEIREFRMGRIGKEMGRKERAVQWVRNKQDLLVNKIMKIPQQQTLTQQSTADKYIRGLVLQDVTAVLVYIVQHHPFPSSTSLLPQTLHKVIVQGQKKAQMSRLYSKSSTQQLVPSSKGQNCSSRCMIYTSSQLHPFQLNLKKIEDNVILDEIIADAIRENNTPLFMAAVAKLHLQLNL